MKEKITKEIIASFETVEFDYYKIDRGSND